jgi:septal ring-binding cell division protein DamX
MSTMNNKKGILLGFALTLSMGVCVHASSGKFYTIQISSPQHEKQAKTLIAQLKSKGIESFEARIMIHGQKHYRVCTGYFENVQMAKAARRSIARQTRRKDVFVQRMKASVLPDKMVIGDFN